MSSRLTTTGHKVNLSTSFCSREILRKRQKVSFEQQPAWKFEYRFIMSKKSPNQTTNSTSSFDMVIHNTPIVSLVLLMSISLTADVYSSVAN